MGVNEFGDKELGAGDQGLMFSVARNETDRLMSAHVYYAQRWVQKRAKIREYGQLCWLRPGVKKQQTLLYLGDYPVGIDAVLLSTKHDSSISLGDLREVVMQKTIKPLVPIE